MEKEVRILGVTCFGQHIQDEDSWERGLSWNPDVIAAQGTGADGGPATFGSDIGATGSLGLKGILKIIILSAKRKGIPFCCSVGRGSGTNVRLEGALERVDEIAREAGIKLRVAVIPGELEKEYLKQKIRAGAKIRRLADTDRLPELLSEEEVDRSPHITSQMGPEPIMKALDLDVDGVITGRALDIALYEAVPLKRGFDMGLVAHMAKSIECSALVAEPQDFDSVFAIVRKDHFLVRPTSPSRKCSVVSVAAHSFYERPDPNLELNPGGAIDISGANYEQYDETTVKVSGSRWIPAPYTLKIEGASQVGYRTISMFGIRDERLINCIDWFSEETRKLIEERFHPLRPNEDYHLKFRVYGKNGVLGEAEPVKQTKSHELFVILDVVAVADQGVANTICDVARAFMVHSDYPGRLSTAANIAFPFSPHMLNLGPTYAWNIWHTLQLDDPCEPFKIQVREFPVEK